MLLHKHLIVVGAPTTIYEAHHEGDRDLHLTVSIPVTMMTPVVRIIPTHPRMSWGEPYRFTCGEPYRFTCGECGENGAHPALNRARPAPRPQSPKTRITE